MRFQMPGRARLKGVPTVPDRHWPRVSDCPDGRREVLEGMCVLGALAPCWRQNLGVDEGREGHGDDGAVSISHAVTRYVTLRWARQPCQSALDRNSPCARLEQEHPAGGVVVRWQSEN